MRNFLAALFGGPSKRALAHAHEQAEIARLKGLNREPPPGDGWRLAPQDSEGKWTVWNGPRPMASFWDENEAAEWARRQNRDPGRPNPVDRDDGKYCVNCGSHEMDDSLKARGYVSCCPERYVIPELWHVTADRLATGNWHLWRPDEGLPSITDDSWADKADARHEADHRNLLAFRNAVVKPAALAGSPDAADALAYGLTAAKLAATDESGHSPGFGVEWKHAPDPRTRHVADAAPATEWDGVEPPRDLGRFNCRGDYVVPQPEAIHESPPCQSFVPGVLAGPVSEGRALRRADFLNVPIPDGVRQVVGPIRSPDDGNWWTFDRNGPVRGYTRRTNAQAAAERANNAPQT